MIQRLRLVASEYPSQFWLLTWGMLVSTIGSSMVWPFLTIYLTKKLSLPLFTIATLFAISAVTDLIFSFIAGPIVDKTGRKRVMVFSLIANGIVNIMMSQAGTLEAFAILMALNGAINPLYRVGADAMLADLVPGEKRAGAYSWTRMANNLGIALGPTLGGFISTGSYTASFLIAAAGLVFYGLLVGFFAKETIPQQGTTPARWTETLGGYKKVVKDGAFISFSAAIAINTICAVMIWQLMSVYANTNYGISESQYGLIPSTNAAMVVLLQFMITRFTKRRPPLLMAALGALIYAVSAGMVAFATDFWGFWSCMVLMTFGELILVPTATTWVANRAPADMRGRYMSLYGLTWSIARGIGPAYGGLLNDNLGPRYMWIGSFAVGLIASTWLLLLFRRMARTAAARGASNYN